LCGHAHVWHMPVGCVAQYTRRSGMEACKCVGSLDRGMSVVRAMDWRRNVCAHVSCVQAQCECVLMDASMFGLYMVVGRNVCIVCTGEEISAHVGKFVSMFVSMFVVFFFFYICVPFRFFAHSSAMHVVCMLSACDELWIFVGHWTLGLFVDTIHFTYWFSGHQ